MTIPVKSLKNGFTMPVFGLGTWKMGGDRQRDPTNDDEKDIKAIRYALQQGITHIDTAEMYAQGHAEELVSEGIKSFDRSKLFLVSKVWPNHLHYTDVLNSCKNSLKRLGTNYLDLYLIHMPNPDIDIAETMKAMDFLVGEGRVKNIGVANFSVARLREAQQYCKHPIVANQVHYNLIYREPQQKGLLSYCQEKDIMIVAWRPVQYGQLTNNQPEIMKEMTEKYQKTPANIAINWLISQHNVVTLAKMSNPTHVDENLSALNWSLLPEDVDKLRTQYPDQKYVSDAVPLI